MAARTNKTNTAEVTKNLTSEVTLLENKRTIVAKRYQDEPKVKVQGSPMYKPFFGNNMPIIVNGIAIYVPLDGQQYEIPETYAAIFQDRIARIDTLERRRKSMADVQNNSESYAGERELIKKV
jgi:hypothetical protein